MNIKRTLQGWEETLTQEAKDGNDDAIAILDWMERNRWKKAQRHLPPKPYKPSLQSFKPKQEV